jgi:hypothetical protein
LAAALTACRRSRAFRSDIGQRHGTGHARQPRRRRLRDFTFHFHTATVQRTVRALKARHRRSPRSHDRMPSVIRSQGTSARGPVDQEVNPMRKTMLVAFFGVAGVLAAPAFAQVAVGGAAHLGANARTGGLVQNTLQTTAQTTDRVGTRTDDALRRAHRAGRRTADTARSRANAHAGADADLSTGAGASAAGTRAGASGDVRARANLDTTPAVNRAAATGHAVGSAVRDTAHSAVRTGTRAANAAGDARVDGQVGVETHGH